MGTDPQIPATPPPESVQSSDPVQEPVDPPATDYMTSSHGEESPAGKSVEEDQEEEEEREVGRDPKRRRVSCPSALDTYPLDAAGLSFSFDTAIEPVYSTPKFGSFCLGLDLGAPDLENPVQVWSPEKVGGCELKEDALILPEAEHRVALGKVDVGDRVDEER